MEATSASLAELEEEHGGEEGVLGALDRVSQTLTGRIRELAERYATPLPALYDEVAALAARVDEHIRKMGRRGSDGRLPRGPIRQVSELLEGRPDRFTRPLRYERLQGLGPLLWRQRGAIRSKNSVNSRAELLAEGSVKYIHYGDVHASTDVYMSPALLPCLPEAKAASLDRLRDGDLIFADASEDVAGVSKSVEVRCVGSTDVVSGLHTIAARFDKQILADGFKGYLEFCTAFAAHLRRPAAGTKVYATNRAHIASVEMPLPSVAEQTAIASVLFDMDAELSALEARRDKTRQPEQGMIRKLLTGRIRLA